MKFIKIILSLIITLNLNAQSTSGLHIYYNSYDETIEYKSDGKTIDKPIVSKGESIHFHILEFNDYLYEATFIYKDTTLRPHAGNDLEVIQDFSNFSFEKGNSFSGLFDGLKSTGDTFASLKTVSRSDGRKQLFSEYENIKNEIVFVEELFKEIEKNFEQLDNASLIRNLASNQIVKSLQNPNLKPSRIKKEIEEIIKTSFLINNGEIELSSILQNRNLNQVYQVYKKDFKNNISVYRNSIQEIEDWLIHNEREINQIPSFRNLTELDIATFQYNLGYLSTKLEQMPHNEETNFPIIQTQELMEIKQKYDEIKEKEFTVNLPPFQADKDLVSLQLDISKIADQKTIKTIKQEIKVTGGLKINSSVGIGFGQSFEKPYKYSTSTDAIIVGTELDDLTPVITTLMHVYKQPKSNVALAGTFGMSIPFLNNETNSSLGFILGPSVIFGSQERFVLTGGLQMNKVTRLDEGYKIGDKYLIGNGVLPTTNPYELGYYFGISFNVSNN